MTTTFDLRNRLDSEFDSESDRSCAILTVCLLEEELAHLLGALLPGGLDGAKQFMPKGRLSFGIANAHRLGLIDDQVVATLRLLVEIRNAFAHGIFDNVSFHSEHIRGRVEKLALPNLTAVPDVRSEVEDDPRKRYIMAFDNMFFTLNEIKNHVTRLPRMHAPTLSITRIPRSPVI